MHTERDNCLQKQRGLKWENLTVTPHPKGRRAQMSPPGVQGTCLVPELQLFAHQKKAVLLPAWWDLDRGKERESLSLRFCSVKQAPRQTITSRWKCNNSHVSHGVALLHSRGCYGMSDPPPVPTARILNSSSLWNSSTPRTIQSAEADLTFPWKRYNGLVCVAITYIYIYLCMHTHVGFCLRLPQIDEQLYKRFYSAGK